MQNHATFSALPVCMRWAESNSIATLTNMYFIMIWCHMEPIFYQNRCILASNTRAVDRNDFNNKHPKGPILPLTLTSQYCSTINTGGCNVLLNSCPRLCLPHITLFVLHRGRNFCTCKTSRNLFFFLKNTPLSIIWEDS